MPTYSDDGQWWWDGRAWQPVTQQQYVAPPQQYQGQQQPQYGGGQPPYQQQGFYQPQQPPKKKRTPLIVAGSLALVLVVGIGAGVVIWRNNASDDTATGAPPKDAKIIEPGQPVTEQTLSEVNPQAFHESVIKRQMTTPIGRLKTAVFEDSKDFMSRESLLITDMAVDHTSGEYSYATSILDGPDDPEPGNRVCTGGPKPMIWSTVFKRWRESPFEDQNCTRMPFRGSGDAIASTGLTADQADKVIAYLRSNAGFVNPAQPTLLATGGKTYVRQVVDFKPVVLSDKSYWGAALPMWGLREAGLDPSTWKWSNPYPLGAGIHMVYYLDTATLLPVAAFQSGIDSPEANGKPAIEQPLIQVVNYTYPTALPVPKFGNSPNTLTISLPEGWKVP